MGRRGTPRPAALDRARARLELAIERLMQLPLSACGHLILYRDVRPPRLAVLPREFAASSLTASLTRTSRKDLIPTATPKPSRIGASRALDWPEDLRRLAGLSAPTTDDERA